MSYLFFRMFVIRRALTIPKGKSESVNRRRTDNTMAKRKSTKEQTTKKKTQPYT